MKKSKFGELLKTVGLKKTKHRLLLLDLLHQHDEFLSADDLFLRAKAIDDSISLSTVYRILDSFIECEIVSPVSLDDQKQLFYELKHEEHAHHLICTRCHKVIHVHSCPVHDFEEEIQLEHHFHVEKHKLEFYGVCEECMENEKETV